MSAVVDAALPAQSRVGERGRVLFWQAIVLLAVVLPWEGLTRVPWFQAHTVLDPFFISRPSLILAKLWDWTFGAQAGFLWPHLRSTVWATLLGFCVGTATGFLAGLALSQYRFANKVLSPFIVALNSTPRIAFVPLITMVFGLGLLSKVVTSWFVVFFVVFFNAYKGGNSIERELLDFCRTLGGSPRQVTLSVRVPTAMAWTFTALPNAVSFALIGVVISEFVGSTIGVGYLMIVSLSTLNAAEMFAALASLSLVGVALVFAIQALERRILHWSPEFRSETH